MQKGDKAFRNDHGARSGVHTLLEIFQGTEKVPGVRGGESRSIQVRHRRREVADVQEMLQQKTAVMRHVPKEEKEIPHG